MKFCVQFPIPPLKNYSSFLKIKQRIFYRDSFTESAMAGAGKMSGGGNYVTDSFTDIIVPSNLDLGKIFLLIVANLLWKLVVVCVRESNTKSSILICHLGGRTINTPQ